MSTFGAFVTMIQTLFIKSLVRETLMRCYLLALAASALASTTNEAKLATVDTYIEAPIPQEGVQDVANTNVAGVLRTMDCPKCSIQALYPRADKALRRG